jgi:hypothetical protein
MNSLYYEFMAEVGSCWSKAVDSHRLSTYADLVAASCPSRSAYVLGSLP